MPSADASFIYLPQSAQRASGGSPLPGPRPSSTPAANLTWEAHHMWPAHAAVSRQQRGALRGAQHEFVAT